MPPPGFPARASLPRFRLGEHTVRLLHWRRCFLLVLAVAVPARADDLVSTTQSVVSAVAAGALPASVLGNVAVTTQLGFGNVAVTNQTGTGNVAQASQSGSGEYTLITEFGYNNTGTIQQSGPGNSAVLNLTNSQPGTAGWSYTIIQTGIAPPVTITKVR